SRRGAWEMSRNTNNALRASYWEAKGLKSLLSRYLELR
ncbi:transcription elongation factor GreAB, partial [Paenibacillus sp. KR2-11]